MEEPSFVTFEEVCILHTRSLVAFGGADGIRDQNLIESALGSAQNTYFYGSDDRFSIAAAYAFHIAQAQAFFDGNKRTAISTALTFLKINGIPAHPDERAQMRIYEAMIAIAEKRLDKAGLAALFRELFS